MQQSFNNNSPGPIRLFISKSAEELELLPDFCVKNNIVLNTHSFLSFEEVPFKVHRSSDAVFFASPRAARFFLRQSDLENRLIAVAGESTRKIVESLGFEVHFSPENSGNVEESSHEFAEWLNGRSVLFPTSDISQKSYTRKLDPEQFETIQVYKTRISAQKIEQSDIYVFTSLSNVEGFLRLNSIPSAAQVIAWGETTFNAIQPHVVSDLLYTLEQSSEAGLIALVKGLR